MAASNNHPVPPGEVDWAPFVLFIQGDRQNQWFPAKSWQTNMYLETLREHLRHSINSNVFGNVKRIKSFDYVIVLPKRDAGGKYILRNITTGRERELVILPGHTGAKVVSRNCS